MTRFEYIEALKQALSGLPPEFITATATEYERIITERSAAGQSEGEIMADLGEPSKVAAERRAAMQSGTFKRNRSAVDFARLFFSFIGLTLFNLFMLVPGIIYTALLISAYAVAMVCYSAGMVVTASGLAGVTEFTLDDLVNRIAIEAPAPSTAMSSATIDSQTSINIGKRGIRIESQPATSAGSSPEARSGARSIVDIGPTGIVVQDGTPVAVDTGKSMQGNAQPRVDIDLSGISIHRPEDGSATPRQIALGDDFFKASRPQQIGFGICLTLAGILLFLLCLVVSKYTLAGLCRLARMEFSVLKNA